MNATGTHAQVDAKSNTMIFIGPNDWISKYYKGYSQSHIDSAISYMSKGSIDDEKHFSIILKNSGHFFYRKGILELVRDGMKSLYMNNPIPVPQVDKMLDHMSKFKYYDRELQDPYVDAWKLENKRAKIDSNTICYPKYFDINKGHKLYLHPFPNSYIEIAIKNVIKKLKPLIKNQSIYKLLDYSNGEKVLDYIEKKYDGSERQRIIFNIIYIFQRNHANKLRFYSHRKMISMNQYFEKELNTNVSLTKMERVSWLMALANFLHSNPNDKSRLLRSAYIYLDKSPEPLNIFSESSIQLVPKKLQLVTQIGESIASMETPYSKKLAAKYVFDFYSRYKFEMDSVLQAKTIALYCRYALKLGESEQFEKKEGTVHFSMFTLCNFYYPLLKDSSGIWGQIVRLNLISTERWFRGQKGKLSNLIYASLGTVIEYQDFDKNIMDFLIRITLLNSQNSELKHEMTPLLRRKYCIGEPRQYAYRDGKRYILEHTSYRCIGLKNQIFFMSEMLMKMTKVTQWITLTPLNYKYYNYDDYYFDYYMKNTFKKPIQKKGRHKLPVITNIPMTPKSFSPWEKATDYSRLSFNLGIIHSQSQTNIQKLRLLSENKNLLINNKSLVKENVYLESKRDSLIFEKRILTEDKNKLVILKKRLNLDISNKDNNIEELKKEANKYIDTIYNQKMYMVNLDTSIAKKERKNKALDKRSKVLSSEVKYFQISSVLLVVALMALVYYLRKAKVSELKAVASERENKLLAETMEQLGHNAPGCIQSILSIEGLLPDPAIIVLDRLSRLLNDVHLKFREPSIPFHLEQRIAHDFIDLQYLMNADIMVAHEQIEYKVNDLEELSMPSFVLLNLIINAFDHGKFWTDAKVGNVRVDLSKNGDWCILKVFNIKKPVDQVSDEKPIKSKSTGLDFIRGSLKSWNDQDKDFLSINETEEYYIATVKFKYKTHENI